MPKPLIRVPNEPAFAVDLTRSGDPIPSPLSGVHPWPATVALVHPDPPGDPSPDHRFAHLQPVAGDRDLVWRGDRPVALLHLHGVGEITLAAGLGDAVAGHPRPADGGALAAGTGRFDQSQDRT